MSESKYLRSNLSNARGLGSAKKGTGHWVWQRLTAITIGPLAVWLLVSVLTSMQTASRADLSYWMGSPINAMLSILLSAALFYHAKLGVQVVVEDYVHNKKLKILALVLLYLVFILAALISIASIAKLHLMG